MFFLWGCRSYVNVDGGTATRYPMAWSVVETSPDGVPVYLSNGRLGIRIFPSGFGYKGDGKELPCFAMMGDVVLRLPSLAGWRIFVDGEELQFDSKAPYHGELSFRNGLWFGVWMGRVNGERIRVRVESVVHPERALFAQRVEVLCKGGRDIQIESLFRGGEMVEWGGAQSCRMRMEAIPISEEEASVLGERFVVLVRVFHRWLPSRAWSFSSLGDGWRFTYKGGAGRVVVERVLDLEHSPEHFEDRGVSSFDEVLRESERIWDERWRGDIEIDGPIEDQQVIRSFLFYLYANGSGKLPPMGLSDGRYKGHRFWDAEGWMLPVYAFLAPAVAREATEWRVGFLRKLARSSLWLRVPWEMGVAGDQTPPAFREAIHVGGWVFWWLEQAKALGFIRREDAEDVQLKIVRFFFVRSIEKGGRFHLLGVVSPDEGRLRDNDLVTNMLAKYCALTAASTFVGISEEERKNLQDFAQRLVIPMVGAVPATYESDPLMTYQQASALLALFPLEWDFGKEINEAMFDRYKDRISPLGPAMSDSIHSVIAARLGRGEEAYRYWRRSWEPFLRAWMGYSE
ncbi:MAG: hypothetical protein QXI19_10700, partial [Candidatus Caldarchaeum sp.]